MLFLATSFFCIAQTTTDITFEKSTQKFKKLDEGHQVTLNYVFNYSGNEILTIIPPKVDCSCTQVILPEGKIVPGKTYTITIKFDTNDKIGWQEREVIIQFTSDIMDSNVIEKKLVFKGIVKASKATKKAYKANQKKIKFTKRNKNETITTSPSM